MSDKKYSKKEKYKYQKKKIYVITPKQEEKSHTTILYLHGGSYVGKLRKAYWKFLRKLCRDTGYTFIVPDYPLAPKNTYKEVFAMILPFYQEIIKKVNSNQLILMGDSAGGGLALALLEQLGKIDMIQPTHTILISPWLDISMTNPEIDEVQKRDKVLKKIALKIAGEVYAGREDKKNYLVSPLYGPLEHIKSLTIFTGTDDILNPDVHVLIEKARQQNITINLKETPKATHIWIIENKKKDELAKTDYETLVKLLKSKKEEKHEI